MQPANQRKLKAVIEKEYKLSLLGGGIKTSNNVAVSTLCRRPRRPIEVDTLINAALKDVSKSLHLRASQPLVDLVLRDTQSKICVPHLHSTFAKTTGTLQAKDIRDLHEVADSLFPFAEGTELVAYKKVAMEVIEKVEAGKQSKIMADEIAALRSYLRTLDRFQS